MYVVTDEGRAQVKPVVVDTIEGADALISKGIEAGDKVVTEGQNQLRPDGKVTLRQPGGGEAGGDSGADHPGGGGKRAGSKKQK